MLLMPFNPLIKHRESNKMNTKKQSIANFAAIETAIANKEEARLKELLKDQTIPELEKSYLIDLVELNNDPAILKIINDIKVEK